MKLRTIAFIFAALVPSSCSRPDRVEVAVTPTPYATRPPAPKGFSDPKIQAEADRLSPLFGRLPKVAVYVVDEPIAPTNASLEPGVAYTVCSPEKIPTVYLKRAFTMKAPEKQITNILKHELTHAWFCTQGIQTGHDARFRAKLREVGGFGN